MSLPWYRQFWPWFLILLPMIAVIMGTSMLVVSIKNPVNLVSDDYYREGQEINEDLARLRAAKALKIHAIVSQTPQADQLIFTLNLPTAEKNNALQVKFFHTTLQGQDFQTTLTADATGLYRLLLDKPLRGKWRVSISAMNQSWRIQHAIEFPLQHPLHFPN